MKLTRAAAALTVVLLAGGLASAQTTRQSRLQAARYNAMRQLAEYVDDGAGFTLEAARDAVGSSRNTRERNLMTAIRNFQRQARAFHNRVDQYEFEPWEMQTELERLRTAARNVNSQLGRVPAMSSRLPDWQQVVSDINDMTRLVAGNDVTVRRPTAGWDTGPHHETSWPTYGGDDLRGQRLEQFRTLARDLDTRAARAYQTARARRADYTGTGEQLLEDLEHFSRQTSQVRARVDMGDVRPRDIGPLVTHLLEDARRADNSMRRARVYTTVWEEWTGVIRNLEEMSTFVR